MFSDLSYTLIVIVCNLVYNLLYPKITW